MTRPVSRPATPVPSGPRPLLLTVAAVLLGVTALLALLQPVSLYSSSRFVQCSVAVGNAASPSPSPSASTSGSASASPSPSPSTSSTLSTQQQLDRVRGCLAGTGSIAPDTSVSSGSYVGSALLSAVIPFVLLGGLAWFAYRGTPVVRWFVVGLWVVANLGILVPFAPLILVSQLGYGIFPALYLTVLVLGTLTFTAAAVLLNLPEVTRYLNARRPVRTASTRPQAAGAGGLFGGLFGPRPPRGGAGGPTGGPTSTSGGSARVSMDKAATRAPANGSAPAATRPARSKGRGDGSAAPDRPAGGATNGTRPGRARGKRRG